MSGELSSVLEKDLTGIFSEKIFVRNLDGSTPRGSDEWFRQRNPKREPIRVALERALHAAESEQDFEKAIHEINRAYPPLAQLVRKRTRRLGLVFLIPLLAALLRGCTLSADIHVDVNQLFDQAMVAIEHTDPYPFSQNHIEDQSRNEQRKPEPEQQQGSKSPQTKKQSKRAERRDGQRSERRPGGKPSGPRRTQP